MRQASAGDLVALDDPMYGIYVHYPLCTRRCGYCDFATVQHAHFPHGAYREQIVTEVGARMDAYQAASLRTLYFGGGSPSLWPVGEVAQIVEEVITRSVVSASTMEITMEVNPGDLDRDALRSLREAGINRLSIGVQSLDDEALRFLTRTHDAARGRRAFDDARRAGFDNISCDLICGLPEQGMEHHLDQIAAMAALGPEHISLYSLTLAPRSQLYRRGFRPREDDAMAHFLERGRDAIEDAGYEQYEVSNYARKSRESLHNSLVWAGMPYLGVGASAHSMLLDDRRQLHIANPPFAVYKGASLVRERPTHVRGAKIEISEGRLAELEVLMLGLRTRSGVDRARFTARFGPDSLDVYEKALDELERWGLIVITPSAVYPTRRGFWFADELALRLARI